MQGNQGSARTEAERLVATVLAMASAGGLGGGGSDTGAKGGFGMLGDLVTGMVGGASERSGPHVPGGWSTGTAECCVCPICKVIAGLRDPSPETAERLATGAGDFAAGVASLLRAFSAATGSTGTGSTGTTDAVPRTDDDPWAAATAAGDTPAERVVPRPTRRPASAPSRPVPPPAPGTDPWAAATTNHDAGTGDEARPDGVA
jgi:hypothetical protein